MEIISRRILTVTFRIFLVRIITVHWSQFSSLSFSAWSYRIVVLIECKYRYQKCSSGPAAGENATGTQNYLWRLRQALILVSKSILICQLGPSTGWPINFRISLLEITLEDWNLGIIIDFDFQSIICF